MFVKRGSTGDDVVEVQRLLNKHGYGIGVDGGFGDITERAVLAFQKSKGLLVDGKVGDDTYDALKKFKVEQPINSEQPWMIRANKAVGLKEVKGGEHNPEIVQYWKDIKRGGIKNDETPWCAAFVGAMLERSGIRSTRFESAKSYLDWGTSIPEPVDGCVVVFSRSGGGHVGFVVGQSPNGNLLVLGGNQGDAVNIKEFSKDRVTGYRYPTGHVHTGRLTVGNSAEISDNEA